MMHRRRRHRALKWTLWIVGIIGFAVVALALIKIDDVVMAQGIAEPGQKIYIDSPLKRVVHQILCYPGTPVKIGQPVARLYDADLRATAAAAEKEVQGAEANLEVARAQLALLKEQPTPEELKIAESKLDQAKISLTARKQEVSRAEYLYLGERLWSQDDMERAQTNYELAEANLKVVFENLSLVRRGASPAQLRQTQAEVRQTEAALDKARQDLSAGQEALALATLLSPVNGIVARLDLYPGMLADQGQIVMIIAGSSKGTVISAWIPETNAWKVRLGHTVEILSNLFADPEGFIGLGEVSEVYGYATQEGGSRTFELEIQVKETPLPLKYGSTADLRIIVGKRSIFKIIMNIEDGHLFHTSPQKGPSPTLNQLTQQVIEKPVNISTEGRISNFPKNLNTPISNQDSINIQNSDASQ